MNEFIGQIIGKKVLVFGVGRQGGGTGDAAWLESHGAIVRLSDQDTSIVAEGQTSEQIDWAEIVIKNPGVPDDHELVLFAKSQHKPVYTSVAIFVKYASVTTIGITGTRGKSTTTELIASMLEQAYPGQVIKGGNIAGTSCLQLFDQCDGKKYAVLELSSFQLHNFHDLKTSPKIAIITNLYPDHLNRYPTMEAYQRDKEAVCAYQQAGDWCFYNQDNSGAVSISQATQAARIGYSASSVMNWETSLPGLHNRENIAAMAALAERLGVNAEITQSVAKQFQGVPFRQEKIRTLDGVTYINDTTATTPIAAIKALQAATSPTIWITGGDTKNLPFTELIDEVKANSNIKKIIILGSKNIPEYTAQLQTVAGDKIVGTASSMSQAVDLARSVSAGGDSVLLSPGFTSFDLFQNEFDRGRQFNDLVQKV